MSIDDSGIQRIFERKRGPVLGGRLCVGSRLHIRNREVKAHVWRVTLNIRNLEYRSRLYMLKGSEVHLQKRCCNNNSGLDVDEPQIQTIDICNWLHSQPLFDYDLTMGIQSRRVALRCDLQKIYPLFSDLFIVFF